MTIALVLFAVVFGVLVLLGLVSAIDQHARQDAADTAWEHVYVERVSIDYQHAWEALNGLPTRLRLFAEASEQLARAYRAAADAGAGAWPLFISDEHLLTPPAELQDNSAHLGAVDRWQALHRALQRFFAVQDDDDPAVHADAHQQVAAAARELSDTLADTPMPIDLDHCWFCERLITEVPRLLAGSHAAVGDDCVQDCYGNLLDR